MPKRILCLILLVFTIFITACSGGKSETKFPKDTKPPYTAENPYIVENLDYTKYVKEDPTKYQASNLNKQSLDEMINYSYSGSLFIVQKKESKSYYYKEEIMAPSSPDNMVNDTLYNPELAYTCTWVEIKEILTVGKGTTDEMKELKKGDMIQLYEPYALSPNGEFVSKVYSDELNVTVGASAADTVKGQYMKNDGYYLLGFSELTKIAKDAELLWGVGLFFVGQRPLASIAIQDEFLHIDYTWYKAYDLSDESLAEAKRIVASPEGHDASEINYSETVIYIYENYSDIISDDHSVLILTLGFAAIFLCIIAVGIILAKRSKSTPIGTPPTFEQNSPDAQDTPDTPIAEAKTASPPDVTEPPGPPKEE